MAATLTMRTEPVIGRATGPSKGANVSDIEERLDRIGSELEIRKLTAEYCHGADKRDLDRFLAVWAPSATWSLGEDSVYEGRAAIARVVQAQWRTFPQYVHWTSNHSIWVDRDQARGEIDVSVVVRLPSGRWVRTAGTYIDQYQRIDGTWLIVRRDASTRFDIDPRPDPGETRLRFDGKEDRS